MNENNNYFDCTIESIVDQILEVRYSYEIIHKKWTKWLKY